MKGSKKNTKNKGKTNQKTTLDYLKIGAKVLFTLLSVLSLFNYTPWDLIEDIKALPLKTNDIPGLYTTRYYMGGVKDNDLYEDGVMLLLNRDSTYELSSIKTVSGIDDASVNMTFSDLNTLKQRYANAQENIASILSEDEISQDVVYFLSEGKYEVKSTERIITLNPTSVSKTFAIVYGEEKFITSFEDLKSVNMMSIAKNNTEDLTPMSYSYKLKINNHDEYKGKRIKSKELEIANVSKVFEKGYLPSEWIDTGEYENKSGFVKLKSLDQGLKNYQILKQ